MNKQAFFLNLFLFLFTSSICFAQQTNVVMDYSFGNNEVIFNLNDRGKMSLKFLDSKNIKFWYSPEGDFKRNNESFAVISEDFDPDFKIDINESQSMYEIFTGDLRVMVYKSPFKVQIFNKYQKLLLSDTDSQSYTVDGSQTITKKKLRDDEHFFGLGEKVGSLDRRGKSFTMWNSDKPCYSDSDDPLYKSIPFFISTYNYGIFFDNTYKTTFDFGEESSSYYSFSSPNGPFIYYFMYGKDYEEIIGSYVKLTGKPIMPPEWALGWSQSRGMLTNEKLTRDIANEYRKRNIPCDIIYQDIGWVEGLQNFKWRKDRYENPKKMLSDLAANGFKVIVSQDPVISQNTKEQWQEANEKKFLVKDERTSEAYDMPWPWGGNAGVVDFTKPEVANWWGNLQQMPIDDGIKGFWTDMGEPAWSNEESTDRLHMKHHSGMHDEIHNVYGLTWDKVVTEQFEKHNPNQRVFQMTRAAYSGLQRYTFGWSGDSGNGENVTDGWDNLANQIPLGLSAGLGLIPFWTTDISGYCGDITDYQEFAELYIRWLQFGIFNPLSRAHHEGNNAVEPWLFGEKAEQIAKKSIELKYQLHPYLYTYARKAYDTGLPIMRALVLEFPNDEKTFSINDQFMFGKEFLIAPVIEKGVSMRNVYLPKGKWVDYNNPKATYDGGQIIEYPVTLSVIPMFIKSGAIIPKMPVMPFINAIKNKPIFVEVFPSDSKTYFELYEDDGVTNDYKKDVFRNTKIECQGAVSKINVVFHKTEINGLKTIEPRNYFLEMHMDAKPRKVFVNGNKIKSSSLTKLKEAYNTEFEEAGFYFDKDTNILLVRTPDTKREISIEIEK